MNEKPVLVGVDGSASALHAVRWAAREAVRRGRALRLFHACFLPPKPHVPVALPRDYRDALLEQGRQWLGEAADAVKKVEPEVVIHTDLRAGVAADLLVTESAEAELVVLGSRGLGGFSGLLVGSVAVALAHHGHCPVVVVRGKTLESEPPEGGPIVVGVDNSDNCDAALDFAFAGAALREVPLIAVHTWTDLTLEHGWPVMPMQLDYRLIGEDEARGLTEHLAAWRTKYPEVEVIERSVRDRPVRGLLKAAEAEDAQLLVVGSHGRGGFAGMCLGSTSQGLLHHSSCPVAVIRS
ncbi:universal stress protein [Amycolatopsis sp. 195334CR]|uniref:universal stress protein n=1 Tax=Amycolatopsis sp. 195334CR TaxID=2814588 RepID=UPI001A90CAC5|nr:universal stress protein [Amycolatopsis sp. 195334CR]MBN6040368.1 universal stress protein [Amycolatopsis sp. 195334CR]